MVNVFIVHGAYGSPEENWIPWLKSELERLKCRVFVPKFPTPENQSLDSWNAVFRNYEQHIDGNSIFVGHSLGPAFLLGVIERLEKPIKASFFVSGFTGLLGNNDFDGINKTFVERRFYWPKIRKNCRKFFIFHSDNDPYVPLEKAEELGRNLGVEPVVVRNAGHFNENAGYRRFDMLLEEIKKEL